ncbi:malto-oligosyltrehalose synthase [Olivibacter sp. XZL3]|uniref:malto-oligosyltrehalose synthase n=1 Tax=Olivibacter sp. XZL3 TaxID=1735116 RepID=UPI0010652E48|nr:malto-oligosyltrehalose synthase [Olivibacter sp. XZL3]
MANVFNPVASYRIQFHKEFTFADAQRLVPYWQALGIKSLYASPIFEAVPGSMHGYDVTNPLRVNPELGTLDEFRKLIATCKEHQLSWIQDIVPNHMAFHPNNQWLMDVLEKGKASAYAAVFDTAWGNAFFQGAIMVPFLGTDLKEAVDQKEIKLSLKDKKLCLQYYDQFYPVNVFGYKEILRRLTEKAEDGGAAAVKGALEKVEQSSIEQVKAFEPQWTSFLEAWYQYIGLKETENILKRLVGQLNKNKAALLQLCDQQYYRLCSWKETDKRINYRRFFTVNSLICLQTQKDEVFSLTHQFIKQMIDEGCFQGLRIDHIDGLFDPKKYLDDLRSLVGRDVYIVVEKILEKEERLPIKWPVQGTSGYDYLAHANKLFSRLESERTFDKLYRQLIGAGEDVERQILEKKRLILEQHMQGEAENLYNFFKRSNFLSKTDTSSVDAASLKEAIVSVLIFCPVYRFYGNEFPLQSGEEQKLKQLFDGIRRSRPTINNALSILEDLLLGASQAPSKRFKEQLLYFYQRLMQFSGPLMAKGVEDTLMYTYNRFIGHNEVGDSPATFGLSKKDFHAAMEERQRYWPLAMSGTATHDTKRGEDVRARLQALSCLPKRWKAIVNDLERIAESADPQQIPSVNDRYFIYQTILGTYPVGQEGASTYRERLAAYLEKALREAKVNSNWVEPNEAYEKKCIDFAFSMLDREGDFWSLWMPLLEELNKQGMFNSLAQVLLKTLVPGIPDFYQGTEFWDLSFVDPDNRRAVDYKFLEESIQSVKENTVDIGDYWRERQDGRVKLALIAKLLHYRSQYSELFEKGIYKPLKVRGRYRKHVLAFYRRYREDWSIALIPLCLAELCADQGCEIENINWKDTRIDWPDDIPEEFQDVLNDNRGKVNTALYMAELFASGLPLTVLHIKEKEKKRAAGILMPLSSLPSAFGIGDLGPQAQLFASQLAAAGQRYWQLLPLNPTGAKEHYSPYSAYSVFAGNPLLISPEILARKSLITVHELNESKIAAQSQILYDEVSTAKQQLLRLAFRRFITDKSNDSYADFEQFMQAEKDWLDDFALYLVIKKEQQGKAWYQWPTKLKLRDKQAVAAVAKKYKEDLLEIKWQQYEFFSEWRALKTYCETLSIRLLGDIPIYVNYDSADVWINRRLFNLDDDGNMRGVAGVPPDYFNADGQLWGMPTFDWSEHKKDNYAWWVARLKKNLEWYHLVRLDHFRAFYDYWEVSAQEENAINGSWKPGPKDELFQSLKTEIGHLPLIAEDLGDISGGVYELRDRLGLPGMRVLQFAFGDDMAQSLHIPHQYVLNSVVYTGTHDNNTIVGWYDEELDKSGKEHLKRYLGRKTRGANIHKDMIKMAYGSVAQLAIIPMQDVIGLGKEARMNTPATTDVNWKWRLLPNEFNEKHITWLKEQSKFYGR